MSGTDPESLEHRVGSALVDGRILGPRRSVRTRILKQARLGDHTLGAQPPVIEALGLREPAAVIARHPVFARGRSAVACAGHVQARALRLILDLESGPSLSGYWGDSSSPSPYIVASPEESRQSTQSSFATGCSSACFFSAGNFAVNRGAHLCHLCTGLRALRARKSILASGQICDRILALFQG